MLVCFKVICFVIRFDLGMAAFLNCLEQVSLHLQACMKMNYSSNAVQCLVGCLITENVQRKDKPPIQGVVGILS